MLSTYRPFSFSLSILKMENLKKGDTHIHTTLIFSLKYVLIRSAKPNLSLEYIIDTYMLMLTKKSFNI